VSSPLEVNVSGKPALSVDGRRVDLRARKAIALVVYAAIESRPIPRATLAELLWGPGKLTNLRQELSRLRRLPRAAEWLDAGDQVRVQARVVRGRAPFLEGFDDLGTPAFREWLQAQRMGHRVDLHESLLSLLALEPSLPPDVAAQVLRASPLALASAWEDLRRSGDLGSDGLRHGLARARRQAMAEPVRQLLHDSIAQAWTQGPRPLRAEHLRRAGRSEQAALLWLSEGRERGAWQALEQVLALSDEPLTRARALAAQIHLGRLASRGPKVEQALTRLRQLAVATQSPPVLVLAAYESALEAHAQGDVTRMTRHARELRELGDVDDAPALAELVSAAVAFVQGEPSTARRAAEQAVARGQPTSRVRARQILAALDASDDALERARERQWTALREARSLGERSLIAPALMNLATTEDRLQLFDDAADRLDEVLELLGDDLIGRHQVIATSNRGRIAYRRGELGRVRSLAAKLLEQPPSPFVRERAYALRADVEVAVGRWAEAASWLERARQQQDRAPAGRLNGHLVVLEALTRACASPGDAEWLQRAVDRAHALEDVEELRLVWVDIGMLSPEREQVERAAERVHELGAPPSERLAIAARLGPVPDGLASLLYAPDWPRRRALLPAACTVAHRRQDVQLADRARALAREQAQGLLPAQRQSLQARVQGWLQGSARLDR